MKNILIVNGHPVEDSYGANLASAYQRGAIEKNNQVSLIQVRELDFNMNLQYGYKKRMPTEDDIARAIQLLKQADHIVWIFPMWWYGMPALLKGFIDRTFLPDVAFKSGNGKLPQKLLKGKSSRIIMTCDTPQWYDYLVMKRPAINQLKKGVLEFSGITPVKVTYISPIKDSTAVFRKKWIEKVMVMGRKGL